MDYIFLQNYWWFLVSLLFKVQVNRVKTCLSSGFEVLVHLVAVVEHLYW